MSLLVRLARSSDVPPMHRIRLLAMEKRLADPTKVTEACYLLFIAAESVWVAEHAGMLAGFAALDVARREL